jgi:hypothetical protein
MLQRFFTWKLEETATESNSLRNHKKEIEKVIGNSIYFQSFVALFLANLHK